MKDREKEINELLYLKSELIKQTKKEIKALQQEHQRINGELRKKLNLAENIIYDYLYNEKKITKEMYDEFKGLKEDNKLNEATKQDDVIFTLITKD